MARIEIHYKDCLEQLGNEYREINDWFDELAMISGELNKEHRHERHHLEGIEEAVKIFGEDARKVGKVHILRDTCGIPKNKNDSMNGDFTQWLYYKQNL